MAQINPTAVLNYGIIGLGFLLAFLAFRLLAAEQKKDKPSENIIRATYVFMGFSVVVCLLGISSQFLQAGRTDQTEVQSITSERDQILKKNQELLAALQAVTASVVVFHIGEHRQPNAGEHFPCDTPLQAASAQVCGAGGKPSASTRFNNHTGNRCGYSYYAVACVSAAHK